MTLAEQEQYDREKMRRYKEEMGRPLREPSMDMKQATMPGIADRVEDIIKEYSLQKELLNKLDGVVSNITYAGPEVDNDAISVPYSNKMEQFMVDQAEKIRRTNKRLQDIIERLAFFS